MRHLVFLLLLLTGCSSRSPESVVLYTSQDQFYAEEILRAFTARTGIKVRAVFDTESAKTAGLAHRLRAEAKNPQCDVFWSNEEMHTRLLVRDGVIREEDWQSAGARTRRLVINTNLVAMERVPNGLLELTNAVWRGRVALAFPLFGTTQSHFLALREMWGEEVWGAWCEGLVRNDAKVVDGNSIVVRLVGAGECWIGLTDSDDIAAGQRQNLPVAALELSGEMIAIPSTISLVRGAPRPAPAAVLIDYLASPEALQQLVALDALETQQSSPPHPLLRPVDWPALLRHAEDTADFLERTFIR
jgi:iron(III) transport system substrate-binding protein